MTPNLFAVYHDFLLEKSIFLPKDSPFVVGFLSIAVRNIILNDSTGVTWDRVE
jgi:hypothetical protein